MAYLWDDESIRPSLQQRSFNTICAHLLRFETPFPTTSASVPETHERIFRLVDGDVFLWLLQVRAGRLEAPQLHIDTRPVCFLTSAARLCACALSTHPASLRRRRSCTPRSWRWLRPPPWMVRSRTRSCCSARWRWLMCSSSVTSPPARGWRSS